MKSGLGPAFAASAEKCTESDSADMGNKLYYLPRPKHFDCQTLADNLLWAEMEIQRITYEVAAQNDSMSTEDMYVEVATMASVQRYRITYVPALLFVALACIFLVAALIAILAWHTSDSAVAQQYRVTSTLRLLVDCVLSLHENIPRTQAKKWSEAELDSWAAKTRVRYEANYEEQGEKGPVLKSDKRAVPSVVLQPVGTTAEYAPLTEAAPIRPASIKATSRTD